MQIQESFYQMSWKSFNKLNGVIGPHIHSEPKANVPNSPIPSEICLAVALRYFVRGSMLDIMISHGIWLIVDAINSLPDFDMEYPNSHVAQK
jgi:hypothetical protein